MYSIRQKQTQYWAEFMFNEMLIWIRIKCIYLDWNIERALLKDHEHAINWHGATILYMYSM